MPAVLLRCHAAVLTRYRAAPLASPLLRCYAAPMECVRAAMLTAALLCCRAARCTQAFFFLAFCFLVLFDARLAEAVPVCRRERLLLRDCHTFGSAPARGMAHCLCCRTTVACTGHFVLQLLPGVCAGWLPKHAAAKACRSGKVDPPDPMRSRSRPSGTRVGDRELHPSSHSSSDMFFFQGLTLNSCDY